MSVRLIGYIATKCPHAEESHLAAVWFSSSDNVDVTFGSWHYPPDTKVTICSACLKAGQDR